MSQNRPLVSIIVPAYNVDKFIRETIQSVLDQTYSNWELLIADDGSDDQTSLVVSEFTDPRIKYFYQQNKGVGAARNLGLQHMQGDFFCFLDGDDVLPPSSIKSRADILINNSSIDYVDGAVVFKSEDLSKSIRKHLPSFEGAPYKELLRLNPACLFGNTWMIRRKVNKRYSFNEFMTHAEDLYFYLTISKEGGMYSFTPDEILWYRQRSSSAMKNLRGLEKGYQTLFRLVKSELGANQNQLLYLKYKITRIMFASYLKGEKNIYDAIRSLVQNLSL